MTNEFNKLGFLLEIIDYINSCQKIFVYVLFKNFLLLKSLPFFISFLLFNILLNIYLKRESLSEKLILFFRWGSSLIGIFQSFMQIKLRASN